MIAALNAPDRPVSPLLNDTLAETGPGLADDAIVQGELQPGELGDGSDDAVERLEDAGWAAPEAAGSVGGG